MGHVPVTGIWLPKQPLVLASTSRTRRDLLESAGLPVEMHAPDVDERALEDAGYESPIELALKLAAAKAQAVAAHDPGRIVIGADQVLALDGRVFHKPQNAAGAREQIALLQGRSHILHAAVAISQGGTTETFYDEAHLTMRSLDEEAIAAYVAFAGEARVTASVGGYQLEALGIHLFEEIAGDHSTILGLPLLPLLARLRKMDVLAL